MSQLFKNNARSTLAASLATGATSLTVATGEGARFPTLAGTDYFLATIESGTDIEIIKVTARATDSFTIVREQEGTTSPASFASGSVISLRLTAAVLETTVNHVANPTAAHAASAVANTATATLLATDVQGALNELDGEIIAADAALTTHVSNPTSAHAASAISYAGNGATLTATDVEAALDELDNEKQPLDATLTALAALVVAADKLVYATGADAFTTMAFNAAARLLLTDMKFSGVFGEKLNARGSISGAQTIDNALGTNVTATIAGDTTFTFSNPVAAGHLSGFMLELTNGGAYTITWPASVKWPGGTSPTRTAAGVDLFVFTTNDGGTTWHGSLVQKDSK